MWRGKIYAPRGGISFHGSNHSGLEGSMWANKTVLSGSDAEITYSDIKTYKMTQ